MKNIYIITALLFSVFIQAQDMNNEKLEEILAKEADSLIGLSGRWQVTYKELTLLVVTDETHDRMRIITPIAEVSSLDKELLTICLAANYHSALDVKYAISDDLLWSVYIHPLSPLTEEELISALAQVYSAAVTFGSTFSSTELIFGTGSNTEENKKPKTKKI